MTMILFLLWLVLLVYVLWQFKVLHDKIGENNEGHWQMYRAMQDRFVRIESDITELRDKLTVKTPPLYGKPVSSSLVDVLSSGDDKDPLPGVHERLQKVERDHALIYRQLVDIANVVIHDGTTAALQHIIGEKWGGYAQNADLDGAVGDSKMPPQTKRIGN